MTTHDGHHDACVACQQAGSLGFEFTMAFQPIVDIRERTVFAYEALVRGTDGAGAGSILARVNEDNRYRFDQACRTKAVELAARLGIGCYVSINFLPNAVYNPAACIRTTLKAAERYDFPTDRLLFEVTENERVVDRDHLKGILQDYQQRGFKTAIDDFGAGYSGLGLLADFQPDFIKIDMALVRDIESHPVRQAIVTGILSVCAGLDIAVIAEGVETMAEYTWLKDRGVRYIQGFLLAEPGFETLPPVQWPA
jgi:EAL domain-containing protein (putative c-di-GMP-specific phosphodiesterase class I)